MAVKYYRPTYGNDHEPKVRTGRITAWCCIATFRCTDAGLEQAKSWI